MYSINQERQAIELVKVAHKFNGLFIESVETQSGGVWMDIRFDNSNDQCMFNAHVHDNAMCKCMKLGDKFSNISSLMI